MSRLSLYLFGAPKVELDGVSVEIDRRKAMALLIYLAVTGRGHSRDTLATLLWPEYDQPRARGALRRTLSVLNRALQGEWLGVDRDTIDLKRSNDLWVDVEQFRRQLARFRKHDDTVNEVSADDLPPLAETVSLYRDDFLAGFTLRDTLEFDEWQFFQAESLRRELAGALEQLVQGSSDQGEYALAVDYARRWLNLDPLHEPAHRWLMRLYAWTDQRPAALRQYQECVRILGEELGVSPSAETTALYERIRTGSLSKGAREGESGGEVFTPAPLLPRTLTGQPSFFSSTDPTTPSTPFVAREREVAQLNQYLEAALAGQGRVVFVTGEAGSGKTALVQEFARLAQKTCHNLIVAVGNCNAHTGLGDPYLPFREILGLLSGDIESKWAQGTITRENAGRLWGLFPITGQTLVNLGPDLIGTFVSATSLLARAGNYPASQTDWLEQIERLVERHMIGNGSAAVAQSDLFEQFVNVVHSLAGQRPLLLIIDDAQWADVASINLLFHLGRRLGSSRILLVVTYRPDDVALGRPTSLPALPAGSRERHPLESVVNELRRTYGQIVLDLDQAVSRRFVEALVDTEPNQLSEAFRAALYRQTEGHPLFTVELLRAMQERDDIVRDEQGRWIEGSTLNWETLPPRVEAVIEERLGRLESELLHILTAASVEGEVFTIQVISQVQQMNERQLLQSLSQVLARRHYLVREQGEVRLNGRFLSQYRFTHTLFQQYLYNSLSAGERRLLHGEVAAALEEIYAGRMEDVTVSLAHHYAESGQVEQAVVYLLQAGDRARLMYAHQEAADFYQQALALLKEQGAYDRAARTLMKLGLTYHLGFDFQQARQAYQEGFTLWQRVGASQVSPPPPAPHALRVASFNPPTVDPGLVMDDVSGKLIEQLFCGLVTLNPDMDVVPELAQSWEVLAGGCQYVFHLRNDVYWSDGVPVTAADFVYAWQRVLDPATESSSARYLFDIRGAMAFHQGQGSDRDQVAVRALDEVTLLVEMEGPTSYFPQLLSKAPAFPVPRHVVEKYGRAWTQPEYIVTNGPFSIEQWQPGQSLILARNPDYRGQFTGNVQQVVVHLNVPVAEEVKLFEADQLDLARIFNTAEMDLIRQRHAAEYLSLPILHSQFVGFNVRQPPFDDPRVRRAFALACDKEKLASELLSGYYFPANGGFIPPGMPGHSTEIGLSYDPDQARRLLAEAGYPGGRGFPMVDCLAKFKHEIECEYLSQWWRENLGVEVGWQTLEWTKLLDRLNQSPSHIFLGGWSCDYPDPDNILRMGCYVDWTGWRNKTYFDLVHQAGRITNQAERMDLYHQAEKMLIEEASIIPLLYSRCHRLIKPWVTKFPTSVLNWHFWKDVVIEPH